MTQKFTTKTGDANITHLNHRQSIAVIGSGVAGLTTGYLLSQKHDVTLYEANGYLGGHTHTKNVTVKGITYPVNTGFIVYNDWTYPNFIKLMSRLGVENEATDMSFSVRCENTGLEYNGTTLNSLFAQRSNVFKPRFLRMVYDILRFNKMTVQNLQDDRISDYETLGDFVYRHGFSDAFVNDYIVPMGAAIWSASVEAMKQFPLKFFLQFFNNHGMLSVNDRPQWRVISGGSSRYVKPLTRPYEDNIRLNTPIKTVIRNEREVILVDHNDQRHHYDQVVFACHSDQALRLLEKPSQAESDILGSIPFQNNHVVLHTDTRLMPKRKLAWAAWNYHLPQRANACAMVTYNMNILQNFHDAPETFLVTLNRNAEIDPSKIIERYEYSHPVFTLDGVNAQRRHHEISNKHRTHYCGAYWFNGFHEDGVNSALRVAKSFGLSLTEDNNREKRSVLRADAAPTSLASHS